MPSKYGLICPHGLSTPPPPAPKYCFTMKVLRLSG